MKTIIKIFQMYNKALGNNAQQTVLLKYVLIWPLLQHYNFNNKKAQ